MYRRYSDVNERNTYRSQSVSGRIKNILILLLTAAIVVLLVLYIPQTQRQSQIREHHISRMQNDCDEAVRLVSSLSRNAGSDSAATLSKIRSDIGRMMVVNDLSASMNASDRLVPEDMLSTALRVVDNYISYLNTAMDTGLRQTELQNTLESLQITVNGLK